MAEAKAIDAPKSSANTNRLPRTRREAMEYTDIGVSPELPEEMRQVVIGFYFDIGADNQLPENRQARDSYLNRVHDRLIVSNPKVPEDVDFSIIYSHFFHEVLYKRELKGHSPKHLLDVMNEWVTRKEIREQLRQRHYELFPDQAPRQIASEAQSGFDEQRGGGENLDSRHYVDHPPAKVAELVGNLNALDPGFRKAVDAIANNDRGYIKRLYQTYDYYKSKGYYEKQQT